MEPDTTPVQESLSPGKAFVLQKKHYLPIKEWDIQDRPREKFLSGHRPDMPDEELLAILIGSGTENLSALDIAKRILEHFNGNLESLSSRSAKELARKFTGIGTAKAVSILAGMELGRRSFKPQQETELIINSSEKAFQFLRRDLASPYERFFALLLSQSGKLIRKVLISEGGLACTTVDARKIFKFAIDEHCCGLILAHNHPSGNTRPSPEDVNITQKICDGARLLDLHVFDHIIVGNNRYYSFADNNLVIGKIADFRSIVP